MKKRLTLILTALLFGITYLHAQQTSAGLFVRPLSEIQPQAKARKGAGTDQMGVKTTLKYEKIADMKTSRFRHQTFPVGNGFMVVGGYDYTTLAATKSAELYQNGKWTSVSLPSNANDPTFSVALADGRVMIGGGNIEGAGTGQKKGTAIYDPSTQQFIQGPDMTVARTYCNAILVGNKVYVAGNYYEDDKVFDCYDGSKFTAFGRTTGHSKPYLFTDPNSDLFAFSPIDNQGNEIANQFINEKEWYPVDMYIVAESALYTLRYTFWAFYKPLELPVEMRSSDYYCKSENKYYVLTLYDGEYLLTWSNPISVDKADMNYCDFDIPTKDASNASITWRGGVFVNNAKDEVYLIGSSGTGKNQSLHIISYNYKTGAWSIATASGFDTDLTTAAWTLLSNGCLACTGGATTAKTAYIFTPPTAGTGDIDDDETKDACTLVVLTKDNKQHEFQFAGKKPQVKFEGTSLRVIISSKSEAEFAISDIIRFTYTNRDPSGIDDLTIDYNPTEIGFQKDGVFVISQMKEGAVVNIYGMDGKVITQFTAKHAGSCRLNLSPLPKGVYIVKADNITYKIMKR